MGEFLLGIVSFSMTLLAAGCGPAPWPRPIADLDRALAASPKSHAENAPETWAEAERHFRLAREAHENGDAEQAERFAGLGLVEVKIAAAEARRAEARRRLAEAIERRERLAREKEKVESRLEEAERREARERVRRHVEEVVEKARLEAAAEEEILETALAFGERKEIQSAREQVAREMLARAWVEYDVLSLALAGKAEPDTLLPARAALDAAAERLAARDAAGVQEKTERAFVEMRRVRERTGSIERDASVEIAALRNAGIAVSSEDIGPVVDLGDPFGKGIDLSPAGSRSIERACRVLAGLAGARFLALAAAGRPDRPGQAADLAARRAEILARAMAGFGLPADAIAARGCGPASPVAALLPPRSGRRDRAAIVVVLPDASK